MKTLKHASLIFIITFALLEIVLRAFDPLGLAYYDDMDKLRNHTLPYYSGYILQDGVIEFSNFEASIRNGFRVVPDSVLTGKKVYFLGDSVTWGWGVDDSKSWVNLLAKEFHINAINYAQNGYNRDNLMAQSLLIPNGSCVVYVAVGNDAQKAVRATRVKAVNLRLSGALYVLTRPKLEIHTFDDYTLEKLSSLGTKFNLLTFQLDGDYGLKGRVVNVSPLERISVADSHFSVVGNQSFFNQIRQDFETFLESCE